MLAYSFSDFFSHTAYSPFSCNKKNSTLICTYSFINFTTQRSRYFPTLLVVWRLPHTLFGTFSGVAKDKIVVGMPTYGRSFTVPNWSDMKPPISPASAGSKGPITGEAGFLGYLEICLGIKSGGWTGVMTFLRKFKIHIFKQKKCQIMVKHFSHLIGN